MPKIKEVNVFVQKLDDFKIKLRGFRTAILHKAQNNLVREEKDNKFLQNTQRNRIRRGHRAVNWRIICYSCGLQCIKKNQMYTQEYNNELIVKTNENDTQKRNIMNLIKAKNIIESTKVWVIPINKKPTKIIIDTTSDVSLIN